MRCRGITGSETDIYLKDRPETFKYRELLGDLDVDERILLKRLLENHIMIIEFHRLRKIHGYTRL
jgi:hypothetical protein